MKVNAEITLNSKDSSVFKVSFKENVTKKIFYRDEDPVFNIFDSSCDLPNY